MCLHHVLPRRTAAIMKRITGNEHKFFSVRSGQTQLVRAFIYLCIDYSIDILRSISHGDSDLVPNLCLFKNTQMPPIAVPIDHAHTVLARKRRGGEPAGTFFKTAFLNRVVNLGLAPPYGEGTEQRGRRLCRVNRLG